jgi:cytochrome b involved in lipid metabolism
MVEWMKIQKELSSKASPVAPRKIGLDELAKHNTAGDVWMAINGKTNKKQIEILCYNQVLF